MKHGSVGGRIITEGGWTVAKGGLGNIPLTLWIITSAIILYLYIRRANLGIDTHPGESRKVTVKPLAPKVFLGPPAPRVFPPISSAGLTKPFIEPAPAGDQGSVY